jgi:hypothetical protein
MKLNYTKIIVLLVFGILLFAVSSKSQDLNSSTGSGTSHSFEVLK